MREPLCYVFGAGEYFGPVPQPSKDDFVIAADGGYAYLKAHNISVNLIVGDFDSLQKPPDSDRVKVLPQEKDDTDLLASLREGYARGYRKFVIYGGTGGRFDHTMANLQCLAYLDSLEARGFLYDNHMVMTMLSQGSMRFPAEAQGLISVFAFSEKATGVNERGLKYSLENATLQNTFPVGVSNEFTGVSSEVSVDVGLLLIVFPADLMPDSLLFSEGDSQNRN